MKNNYLLPIFFFCLLFSTFISCTKSGGSGGGGTGGGGTGGGGTGGGGSVVNVDMNGMSYSPSSTTVKAGTTVKWTNSDYYSAHTVTSNDGTSFNSGNIAIGGTYSFTPTVAGTFPYHCNVHAGMNGTLIVTP